MEELKPNKSTTGGQHTNKQGKLRPVAIYTCAEAIDHPNTGRRNTDPDHDQLRAETKLPAQSPAYTEHVEAAIV